MKQATTEPIMTEAMIESLTDLWEVKSGIRPLDQARRMVVTAQVDAETTLLSLPSSMIRRLGLLATKSMHITRSGAFVVMYQAVRLTIQGRECTIDVVEAPDDAPALIGRIPLACLDLVADLRNCKLTGNPAHGGEQVYEMY
jgi:hypothetical protein